MADPSFPTSITINPHSYSSSLPPSTVPQRLNHRNPNRKTFHPRRKFDKHKTIPATKSQIAATIPFHMWSITWETQTHNKHTHAQLRKWVAENARLINNRPVMYRIGMAVTVYFREWNHRLGKWHEAFYGSAPIPNILLTSWTAFDDDGAFMKLITFTCGGTWWWDDDGKGPLGPFSRQ